MGTDAQMWELDHKEGWVLKNWCLRTVVLEKPLESPLDWQEIKPVNPKGNQPWIYTGRTDAKAEGPILGPCDAKSWLIGKDPGARKDWRQREKRDVENERVGWHYYGCKFEQAPGVGDGQGSLVCCSPWGCKESDRTEQLNWTDDKYQVPERDWILTNCFLNRLKELFLDLRILKPEAFLLPTYFTKAFGKHLWQAKVQLSCFCSSHTLVA